MTMHLENSVNIIQSFAQQHEISVLDAIMRLDEMCMKDWINTLPGAPRGWVKLTTDAQDLAMTTFCNNRRLWIKQAQSMSVNLEGFSL